MLVIARICIALVAAIALNAYLRHAVTPGTNADIFRIIVGGLVFMSVMVVTRSRKKN